MSNMAELAGLIHLADLLSNMDDQQQRQVQQQLNNNIRPRPQPLLSNFNLGARRSNFPRGGIRPYRHCLNNNNVNRGPGLLPNPVGAAANFSQNQSATTNIFQLMQCPHCNFIQTSRNFNCSQTNCGRIMYTTSNGRSEKCSNCYFPRLSLNMNACPLCFSIYNEIGTISLPVPPILEIAEEEIQN